MNLEALCTRLTSAVEIKNFLLEKNLINDYLECPKCSMTMLIVPSTYFVDGFCFQCVEPKCFKEMSIRHGSFFSKSKLPLKTIILFIYMWSQNMSGPISMN